MADCSAFRMRMIMRVTCRTSGRVKQCHFAGTRCCCTGRQFKVTWQILFRPRHLSVAVRWRARISVHFISVHFARMHRFDDNDFNCIPSIPMYIQLVCVCVGAFGACERAFPCASAGLIVSACYRRCGYCSQAARIKTKCINPGIRSKPTIDHLP